MNPNYVHTITLYRRQPDGTYSRSVLHDCFWKSVTAVIQSGTQASMSNVYTVRIPQDKTPGYIELQGALVTENGNVLTDAQDNILQSYTVEECPFHVSVGDIVVKGECPDWISDDAGFRAAEVLNRYKPDAFKVTAFSDNTSHIMDRHYRLGG